MKHINSCFFVENKALTNLNKPSTHYRYSKRLDNYYLQWKLFRFNKYSYDTKADSYNYARLF